MSTNNNLGGWFERLKRISPIEVAERLGLEKPKGKGNYKSPHRKDSKPSLSITENGWKDFGGGEGGSSIDLVMYVLGKEMMDAADWLGKEFQINKPRTDMPQKQEKKTLAEIIADNCTKNDKAKAVEYLVGRGIAESVINAAIAKKTLGFNNYVSTKVAEGEPGHGGDAVAFIARDLNQRVACVDMRFLDPDKNGGVKNQCQGQKDGNFWTSDIAKLKKAKTVFVVESPINALSIETALTSPNYAALAVLGIANIEHIDWSLLKGKMVFVCLDHTDKVNEATGKRPGLSAAWKLNELLNRADVCNMLVDQDDWGEGCDTNDILKADGAEKAKRKFLKHEGWVIPGMPGSGEMSGRNRIWLPIHDYNTYGMFRSCQDHTQVLDYSAKDENGQPSPKLVSLCGFRVAEISRLEIQGHLSTMTGEDDSDPEIAFGVKGQVPRHGNKLIKYVIKDDKMAAADWWQARFGAIWKPAQFTRMVSILERMAQQNQRKVSNFIGLAWQSGELKASEGDDCFFTRPEAQAAYHKKRFPRTSINDGNRVIDAYAKTFKKSAGLIPLVWGIGAHLKAILGFWPHLAVQAEKGSGKTIFFLNLQRTISCSVFSGEQVKTPHRRRIASGFTSHPIGLDELSKLPKAVLADLDAMLQSTYRFEFLYSGAESTPHLLCAPAFLTGEEVDMKSLQSKLCIASLSQAKQGDLIPNELPSFPMWAWLKFLETQSPQVVRELHRDCSKSLTMLLKGRSISATDSTGKRMIENYAGVFTAWEMVSEFLGIHGNLRHEFIDDLVDEMAEHIGNTDGTRLPWVWIMELFLSELDAGRVKHPFKWEQTGDDFILYVRPGHIMDHLATALHLKAQFDGLPIKTGKVFKQQLFSAKGVVRFEDVEKTFGEPRKRHAHMSGISLNALEKLGLNASPNLENELTTA